jgi:hypothetical protein
MDLSKYDSYEIVNNQPKSKNISKHEDISTLEREYLRSQEELENVSKK